MWIRLFVAATAVIITVVDTAFATTVDSSPDIISSALIAHMLIWLPLVGYLMVVRTPLGSAVVGGAMLTVVIGGLIWLWFGDIDDGLEGLTVMGLNWIVGTVGLVLEMLVFTRLQRPS
jgi:hypothetical protein